MTNFDNIDKNFVIKFFEYFRKQGLSVEKKLVDPSILKRSQKNFDINKAKDIIEKIEKGEYEVSSNTLYTIPIIISSDNYIIHGHHRWYAHKYLEKKIPAYVINFNRKDFLELLYNHKERALYLEVEKSRDIRIGKIAYSLLEEYSNDNI